MFGVEHSGFDEMNAAFAEWKLPPPPVPAALRPAVRASGHGCWATRPTSGGDMYLFQDPAAELDDGPVEDYFAVSHAGHGVNSYAVNYTLVFRGLALYAQESWGGIYEDRAEATARVAAMFDRAAALISAARPGDDTRKVYISSNFRKIGLLGSRPEEQR